MVYFLTFTNTIIVQVFCFSKIIQKIFFNSLILLIICYLELMTCKRCLHSEENMAVFEKWSLKDTFWIFSEITPI
jgi:hypothetical protein